MKKVSLRIEDEVLKMLMILCGTDNVSEAVRIAILFYLQNNDASEKVKTLFPYIGKKPPRIGREVVEAFRQSGCNIFIDLFCGSLAMLCYLPWETKVVVNDINGNLTNLYTIIIDRPSAFIREVMQLPYSEVLFKQFSKDLKNGTLMIEMERAVAYYYISFGAYRGRMNNTMMRIYLFMLTAHILGTEDYYEYVFSDSDRKDLALMLKAQKGVFVLSSKAKRRLHKL